ncbi:MAG: hypothetical protein WCA46_23155 [Actinocatenispora sp.]
MSNPTPNSVADAREHLKERVQDLDDVIEDVSAERSLALFLAYRNGLSIPDIAETVREETDSVAKVIVSFEGDEEADTYEEGPRWIAVWPKRGWSPTF